MLLTKPTAWQVSLVLAVGIVAVSTAAIFARLAFEDLGRRSVGFSLVLAASRLILAALILLPAWRGLRQAALEPKALLYAGVAGLFLALHFGTWISSLAYTSVAAATTLVTTNPIWVTLLTGLWLKEKTTRLTWLGIGVSLLGGLLLALGDAHAETVNSNPLLGDCLALVGAWTFSLHMLFGRAAQRRGIGLGSYVAITYSVAAIVLLPLPWLFGAGYTGYPGRVYLWILLMALLPQLIGHTSLSWAIRWLSPTLVTLAILFEPVISSLLAYLIFQEIPGPLVLVGGGVLLLGVAAASVGSGQKTA